MADCRSHSRRFRMGGYARPSGIHIGPIKARRLVLVCALFKMLYRGGGVPTYPLTLPHGGAPYQTDKGALDNVR